MHDNPEKLPSNIPEVIVMPERLSDKEARERLNEINLNSLRSQLTADYLKRPMVLEHIARLVLELSDKLPKYDLIISDEISARIVTLIINKLYTKIRKHENKEAKCIFLSLGRVPDQYAQENDVMNFTKNHLKEGMKCLVISEYMLTGETLSAWWEFLSSCGLDVDCGVVTIKRELLNLKEVLKQHQYEQDLMRIFYSHIYYGGADPTDKEGEGGALLYDDQEHGYTGVRKIDDMFDDIADNDDMPDKTPAFAKYRYIFPTLKDKPDRADIGAVRRDTAIVAKELEQLIGDTE